MQIGAGALGARVRHLRLRQLAVEVRDLALARLPGDRVHPVGRIDGFEPVLLLLVDLEQELERGLLVAGALQLEEHLLGAIQQAGLEVVLRQLVQGSQALLSGEVGTIDQVLVHADGAFHFPAPAEQAAQGKMQLDGLGIHLDHLDERLDGLVRLLIDEEVETAKVRRRQRARLGQKLFDVDARREPSQAEEDRESDQPPELEFHALTPTPTRS